MWFFAMASVAATLAVVAEPPGEAPLPDCEPIAEAADTHAALNEFWGRSILLCAASDPDESAVALPNDNVVLANREWLADMAMIYGPSVVTGILAHEWGHMVQGPAVGLAAELHADCLAGAFMRSAGFSRLQFKAFEQISLRSGDLRVSDWRHGTGHERRRAVIRGYRRYAEKGRERIADVCPLRFKRRNDWHLHAASEPADGRAARLGLRDPRR